ncbi:hypothetical protein RUM43_010086 [Polyplax serrata]|uniref:Glucose-methanol-choline oxidoreductase N-terminal domain-containing protein n=1 Tax=Polyplax serrata TaxID=468196 RepID=A0AAN8P8C0_POLSC
MAVGLVPIFAIGMFYYRYLMADPESKVQDVKDVLPEYDFIVVGGGSAGAVVANRLSENPNWMILLLEAGVDENELSDVPSLAGYMQLSELDWKYKTAPPPDRAYCQAMNGDRCNWPRGKVLGGSSVLNAMIYVRGNRLDYDYWEAQGNTGWSYEEVLPYFLKSEDNRNPYLLKTPYHRAGGYLTVQESPWRSPLSVAFIKAGKELGYDNLDINGANQTGFMLTQGTVRRGSRCSTAKAFIRPIKDRKNLHVALRAQVTKVLLAELNDVVTAHGVEFIRNNRRYLVNARKEVILSAGAINSPQILMLSGIGPRKHLERLNIPVFRDLKVGYNLQDHVGLGGLTFLVNAPVTFKKDRFQNPSVALEYILRERGPMTTLGVEGLAFVNTKYAPPGGDWPDIQFHFAPSSVNSDNGDQIRKVLGLRDRVYNTVYKPLVNAETWTILPLLLRPKSSGRVSLKSSNPLDYPVIEPNYFRYKEDVQVLIEGIKIAMAISNTTAFQKYGSRPHTIPLPGCGKYALFSDAYWECSLRHFTFTIYHPAGTCKMGPRSDPSAVVDDRLRVHGVRNLRVVDASIMPTIVSGNPNAPVIMIGEKASDFIKHEYFYLDQT